MKQRRFVERYQSEWDQFDARLDAVKRGAVDDASDAAGAIDFPAAYRRVCHHYALARSRRYSPALIGRLEELTWRGHEMLYRKRGAARWRFLNFIAFGFPRSMRRQGKYVLWAVAFFFLPALAMGALCFVEPDIIYSVMSPGSVGEMEWMYNPGNEKIGRAEGRQSESDFVMFGFYIYNNIGIGFRTFAGGILLGIGTVFLLLFNGIVIGGIAGHLSRLGYVDTFWPFVAGHSSFELLAIVLCGASGLMLAHGIIAPGRRTRLHALREKAMHALPLVIGAALMLLLAAFIEAFWSSSGAGAQIKLTAGAVLWVLVGAYLLFAGRRHGP